jgi:endonuclease-3 related protein
MAVTAAVPREASTEFLLDVYQALDGMHAARGWHWWPDVDPFEVVVGAILVQNTSWTNVERALAHLREAEALSPEAMARLSEAELEELVHPSGQYRQKARKLRAFLDLAGRHGGIERLMALDPATLRSELLATWGIGPETADAILVYGALHPVFVVDAYTARLFGRLGLGPAATSYDAWQRFFDERLPADRDLRARYHALIVMHCKHLCLKRAPRCGDCALRPRCGFAPS